MFRSKLGQGGGAEEMTGGLAGKEMLGSLGTCLFSGAVLSENQNWRD